MNLKMQVKPVGPRQRRNRLRRLFLAFVLLMLIALGPSTPNLGALSALAQEPTDEPAQESTAAPAQQPEAEPTQEPTTPPAIEASPTLTPTITATSTQTPTVEASPTLTPTIKATSTQTPTLEVTPPPEVEATPTVTYTVESPGTPPPEEAIPSITSTVVAAPLTPTVEISPTTVPQTAVEPIEFDFITAASPGTGAHAVRIWAVDRESGDSLAPDADTNNSGYRWIVNKDVAHDNASTENPESYSELVATGDDTSQFAFLDPGKYIVTVLGGPFPAVPGETGRDCNVDDPCGYKLSGQAFEIDGSGQIVIDGQIESQVEVQLVPNPLPLATLRVRVFEDRFVDGEDAVPAERGIPGMPVIVNDPTGEVSVDFFGDPICGTGQCKTDADGYAVIPNLPPLRYEVEVVPPDGSGWVQSTTIEGTHAIDAWLEEGASGYSTEVGFLQAAVWFGFVQECPNFGNCPVLDPAADDPTDLIANPNPVPPGTHTITGRVRQLGIDTDAPGGASLGNVVPGMYVALNNTSGNDEQVYTARGNDDGTFSIPNVPPGQYQLVYWDFDQLYIISFLTVSVDAGDPATVDIGDIGIPRWRGTVAGFVYIDDGFAANGQQIPGGDIPDEFEGPDAVPGARNGYRDCINRDGDADGDNVPNKVDRDYDGCEKGLVGEEIGIRFKDGTGVYAAVTDSQGYYDIPFYFEWEHFLIWEVGYGRHEQIGTAGYYTTDNVDGSLDNNPELFGLPVGGDPDDATYEDMSGYPYYPANRPGCEDDSSCDGSGDFGPAALLQSQLTWAGTTTWIDTGKVPWPANDPNVPAVEKNGGISGIVYYASTRNEFDPRLAAAEDYEPGIPNVTVNLYEAALDATGAPIICASQGTGCPYGAGEYQRASDTPIQSVNTDEWDGGHPTDCRYETPIIGSGVFATDPACLELPRTWNQIKDGVFDGGWAFDPTPPGSFIVEVEPPYGYRHIAEEDQNTDQGDFFVTPAYSPANCAGPLHLVNDTRNPLHNTQTRLCDSKLVELRDGFNPGAEFFLMTENAVPPPGMIRGLLVDDLILQFDPDSPLYVEKRGIPNTPIGVLDFENNEIAVVNSDDEGYWEVMLPSTYTAHCPTPGGICPGMYRVVGNYPGSDPLNPLPNWNPNYGSLYLVFDVWPGKTTFADVALVPTTNLVSTGGGDAVLQGAVCEISGPDVLAVSTPFGPVGTSFTITGEGFGGSAGSVTLDGDALTIDAWDGSGTLINVTIPGSVATGPHQLLVTDSSGVSSPTGITFHVTETGVYEVQHHVNPGDSIQTALNAAADGDLIIVHPGVYYENIIIYKNVKLQGYGPGATLIDGRFFNFVPPPFGDRIMSPDAFLAKVASINPVPTGEPVPMGQVITVLAESDGQHGSAYTTQIDGFAIRGGKNVRGNVPAGVIQQGGGIYAHHSIHYFEVSNNLVQTNAGLRGGGIILGQAFVGNNENDNARIHHNRVFHNGGFTLAGGVAFFTGTDDYEIDHNLICGNYSAEYGGGVSHFGLSPGGHIHDNQVWLNYAFDEGGGVIIAGELPANLNTLTEGAGNVRIERNLIQANISNDDGGGIRTLQQAGQVIGHVDILNNMVVNNLATDVGGGISLDDTPDVHMINNTIAKNISTGTAEDADRTSCGSVGPLGSCPHTAGVASEPHSAALLSVLPGGSPDFSNPVMFNNIAWGNEAFHLDSGGAGLVPDPGPGEYIDLEAVGVASFFAPTTSILTVDYPPGGPTDPSNLVSSAANYPEFLAPIDLGFTATPFAGDPAFITVLIEQPASLGDYHIDDTVDIAFMFVSPAADNGKEQDLSTSVYAPCDDFDQDERWTYAFHDIGADEIGGVPPSGTCTTAPPGNVAPTVFASADQTTITLPDFVTLDGTVTDDGLPIPPTLTIEWTWSTVNGTGVVIFGDPNVEDTTASFTGPGDYTLTLSASDGELTTMFDLLITVNPEPGSVPVPVADLYLSVQGSFLSNLNQLPGVRGVDIVGVDFTTGEFVMIFDGSDVGVSHVDIDAFDIQANGSILMSFRSDTMIDSSGQGGTADLIVDNSDIVKFTPTSLGDTTAGTFSMFFEGLLVDLTTAGEDIDALRLLPTGELVISTRARVFVTGADGRDEDLMIFTPTTSGIFTTGTWALYFDGSNVALTNTNEDVDSVATDADGKIYLSTRGDFTVPGDTNDVEGKNEDVFICDTPTSTVCQDTLFFDGSQFNLANRVVDGIDLP